MKILGDSQILLFDELFSSLGETDIYTGRDITAAQLVDVDVLIIRSIIHVNKVLLETSNVKFVGTCTIGTDHLDTAYLDKQGIKWANAPGCNSNAVVQYVLSAMAALAPNWLDATVGIIACGNVGGLLYCRLKALGVDCCVYDPFLSVADNPDITSLENVLESDVISLHAPLTTEGLHPTFHLLGQHELNQIRPNTLLINTGRGAVIDNQALLSKLCYEKKINVVLDVWENEPNIPDELIELVDIATPHIAGNSLEGKEMGTVIVYHTLCDFLQCNPLVNTKKIINSKAVKIDIVNGDVSSEKQLFNDLLLASYNIREDDKRLREWRLSGKNIGDFFDSLRKDYPIRREYSNFIFPEWTKQFPIRHWLSVLVDT